MPPLAPQGDSLFGPCSRRGSGVRMKSLPVAMLTAMDGHGSNPNVRAHVLELHLR